MSIRDIFGTTPQVHVREDATDLGQSIMLGPLLEAGRLVELPPQLVRDVGIWHGVVVTPEVWADCVTWGEAQERQKRYRIEQEETGRLWDLLLSLRRALNEGNLRELPPGRRLCFELHRIPPTGPRLTVRPVYLAARTLRAPQARQATVFVQHEEQP